MKKSSWILLAVCAALAAVLSFVYVQSQRVPPNMTEARLTSMLDKMQAAVAHKNVSALMSYVDISPDTHVAKLNVDQLRLVLSRAFRQSEQLDAIYSNLALRSVGDEAVAEFDLKVQQHVGPATGDDYNGHITLHLKRVQVGHLLGLYHTNEWRITNAESTGPELTNYGDY